MASIEVNPSKMTGAVPVAVDIADNLYYPIYKIAYSLEGESPVQVSTESPFPVTSFNSSGVETGTPENPLVVDTPGRRSTKELLELILVELRISNKFNELGFDEIIDEDSIHEDRRR